MKIENVNVRVNRSSDGTKELMITGVNPPMNFALYVPGDTDIRPGLHSLSLTPAEVKPLTEDEAVATDTLSE